MTTTPGSDLAGKNVVITGSTRGLGLAMARGFAESGANLVVASRKTDAVTQASTALAQEFGVRTVGVVVDVGRWPDLDRLLETAYSEFEQIDVLINNVGMSPLYDQDIDVSEMLYDKVLNVNLRSVYRLSALFGSRMQASGSGSIINISSVAVTRPLPGALPYSAAKAGVIALTAGMAHTLGPTVRVNCISAGFFATDISRHWTPDQVSEYVNGQAIPRLGRPSEIVGAALYFGSDASSYATGSVLAVDGGHR